jgi:hypothetical protein
MTTDSFLSRVIPHQAAVLLYIRPTARFPTGENAESAAVNRPLMLK